MRKVIFTVIVLSLVACNNSKMSDAEFEAITKELDSIERTIDTTIAPVKYSTKGGQDAALKEVRKEPKVKAAIITDAGVLYVCVLDDGTKRDGYAQYLCEVLSDYNTTVEMVKVVKFGSTDDPDRDNAYGVLLGKAYCK